MSNLNASQIASYASQAGFRGNNLTIAVAVAMAESGGNPSAVNHDSNGTTDYGLWQINSVHGYNPTLLLQPLYNAQAAFKISGGSNFSAWTTYQTGAYKKYMAASSTSSAVSASSNTFPYGQCTWWACQRYHDLTKYYPPFSGTQYGNAKDWFAGARTYGWNSSGANPIGIPSIICLQPGIQGVTSQFGHVAVVESVNKDGSVYTSNMNWGATPSKVAYVTFKPGPGVGFLWVGSTISDPNVVSGGSAILQGTKPLAPTYTPVMEQVHETLVNAPGFYGIAKAVDEAEQFPGWIDLTDQSIQAFGVNFDVIGWIRSFGATVTDNFLPFAIRSGLVTIGLILLVALVVKAVGKPVMSVAGPMMQAGA